MKTFLDMIGMVSMLLAGIVLWGFGTVLDEESRVGWLVVPGILLVVMVGYRIRIAHKDSE